MTSTTKHPGVLERIAGFFALCGPLLTANPAYCQEVQATQAGQPDQLQEVIVTAQKREQNLQDIPVLIAAVDGDLIENEGFADIQELAKFVPNVFMRNNLTGQQMLIRGIGTGVIMKVSSRRYRSSWMASISAGPRWIRMRYSTSIMSR